MNIFPLNFLKNPRFQLRATGKLVVWGVGFGLMVFAMPVEAQESAVPWECSEYSGEAQTRCMRMLLELQQEKIARLEEQLKTQEGTVNELKEKMDRQEALARREAKVYKKDPRWPPPPYVAPATPSYAPSYGYAPGPPVGIFLPRLWGYPRYYGYGPGYWGGSGINFNFRYGGGHRHYH